jgi:hypothetical protein
MASEDNGILATIPGQYVSRATAGLPEPFTVQWKTAVCTSLQVPGIGRVGFTAEAMQFKHGRSVHYYWNVVRAVLISDPT